MISEYRHTTIYCDRGDCDEAFETSGWSFMDNRKQAREEGWRLGKDKQYCPGHRGLATPKREVTT